MFSRSDLIESEESNIFFIYDAIDSSNLKKRYLLTLHTVRADGTKFRINIYEEDIVFFDIKIKSEDLIPEYKEEFLPDYYELFEARPFDSTEEHRFLHLFYLSLRDHERNRELLEVFERKPFLLASSSNKPKTKRHKVKHERTIQVNFTSNNYFSIIPNELIQDIFDYLYDDPKSQFSLGFTCHNLYQQYQQFIWNLSIFKFHGRLRDPPLFFEKNSLSCKPEYPCGCCVGDCEKTEVTKKIFTNCQGVRYVKSIAPYWSNVEKAICSKVMLLNGTCDVAMCPYNQVQEIIFSEFYQRVDRIAHKHFIYEPCYNSCQKSANLPITIPNLWEPDIPWEFI
ncbi:36876_t:CDS:2 [Racocetra persica]|uniref:36876_t:CDS:1 n=1 Tax=Racocetra persica TaxID=160502 RepID=A0ACA9KT92_9GLOM|nr:36876_t:CDS:2 [Racocetra persica]